MENTLNKTIVNYTLIAAFAYVFNRIYGFFGHGVKSPWMANMYLFLLIFGTLAFTFIKVFTPNIVSKSRYRLFFNIYNSGVAIFVNGMLLRGIIEIAGGTSDIMPWFMYIGALILIIAVGIFIYILFAKEPYKRNKHYSKDNSNMYVLK